MLTRTDPKKNVEERKRGERKRGIKRGERVGWIMSTDRMNMKQGQGNKNTRRFDPNKRRNLEFRLSSNSGDNIL